MAEKRGCRNRFAIRLPDTNQKGLCPKLWCAAGPHIALHLHKSTPHRVCSQTPRSTVQLPAFAHKPHIQECSVACLVTDTMYKSTTQCVWAHTPCTVQYHLLHIPWKLANRTIEMSGSKLPRTYRKLQPYNAAALGAKRPEYSE